ncbi:MAG: hypothetical protein QW228_07830 [Candidatus Aenigmatarchaeota archaeon]
MTTVMEKIERGLREYFKVKPIFEHFPYTLNATKTFKLLYSKIVWTDPIFKVYEYYQDRYYYFAIRIVRFLFRKVLVLEVELQTTEGLYNFYQSFYILEPLF